MATAMDVQTPTRLTSEEVRSGLEKFGPNAVPDTALHPLRRALTHLWAPVPWMLEAAVVLEIVLGKYIEAGVIAVLLAFNAALGFLQEGRAQATLAALNASVRRDNAWATLFRGRRSPVQKTPIFLRCRESCEELFLRSIGQSLGPHPARKNTTFFCKSKGRNSLRVPKDWLSTAPLSSPPIRLLD